MTKHFLHISTSADACPFDAHDLKPAGMIVGPDGHRYPFDRCARCGYEYSFWPMDPQAVSELGEWVGEPEPTTPWEPK